MHDCMNRRQTPRYENIHLAADASDSNSGWMELKGTLGVVVMSDNLPATFVAVWSCHYDEIKLK